MERIIINDVTLRDGSHAISHRLTKKHIISYTKAADKAGIHIVEVGHGNGIGASSLQIGLSLLSDYEMLEIARNNLINSKLGVLVIPGFATIKKDLSKAFEIGVDVVRVASHCTEADTTERHIGYAREKGKEVYGVLMMSHMVSKEVLLGESLKMQSYGAEGIIIMDSAGTYLLDDVKDRISFLSSILKVPIGFHSHNNLGMAIANSITALKSGAKILDGSARGFGAGAGNAQLEVLVAVLEKMCYETNIDLYKILDAAEIAEKEIIEAIPTIKSISIVSGLSGVFSGFAKHVMRVANEYKVNPMDVFFEIGKRKVVAGQEDIIVEVALQLSNRENRGA